MGGAAAEGASYRAVISGATGAVGSAVVRALLASDRCASVLALVRRPVTSFDAVPGAARKLSVTVVDFERLEEETAARAVGCGVAFCTVGIGQPRKVSREEFRRVDVGYAGAFARGAVPAGATRLALLSAVGANATSRIWCARVKGEAEAVVIAARAPRTAIFRPSVLLTDEIRYGLQDRVAQFIVPLVAPILPSRWRPIHVETLGRAMVRDAERERPLGVEYLYYPDFAALVRASPAQPARS